MALAKGFSLRGTARTEGVTRPLAKMQAELDKARKGVDKLNKRFGVSQKASKVLGGALERVGHHLTDLAIQAPFALVGLGKSLISNARDAEFLAKKVGGSTQEVMGLIAAGKRLRIDADNVGEGIKTFQENLGELARIGTGPAKDALGSLGLTLKDFAGLGVEDRLKVFAQAISEVEDPTKRLSIGIEVMGDDFSKLYPLLEKGAGGIDELTAAARRSGQVLDEEAIAKTRELDLAVADMEAQFEGAANTVLLQMLPTVMDMAGGMQVWIGENDEFIKQDLPGIALTIAQTMGFAADAISVVADALARAARNGEWLGDQAADLTDWFGGGKATGDNKTRAGASFLDGTSFQDGSRFLSDDYTKQLAANKIVTDATAAAVEEARLTNEAIAANDALFKEFGLSEDQFQAGMRKFEREAFEEGERRKQNDKGKKKKRGSAPSRSEFETTLGLSAGAEARFDDQASRNAAGEDAFSDFQSSISVQTEDPFSEGNLDMQLERQRAFEVSRSELVLSERMRGIEMLQASGADPLMLIEAEEQARTDYLEAQLQRTDDEISRAQLKDQIEQTHHTATLRRLKEEQKERNNRAKLIEGHITAASQQLEQFAAVQIQAVLSGNQSAKEAVHGLATAKAIEMAIIATSETVQGIALLASVITAPLAAPHFAAAGKAAVAGAAFGVLAGSTIDLGGADRGAGGASGGRTASGSSSSRRERSDQEGPLSRTDGGQPGASDSVQAQNGTPGASNGNNYTVIVNQQALGFGDKETMVHATRVALKDAEQSIGGV